MARAAKTLRTSSAPRLQESRTTAAGRQWYHTAAWRSLRREHLEENPCCADCLDEGVPPALAIPAHPHVDHIKPHQGDRRKFFSRRNLRTRCPRHHSRKTAAIDGGFGNRPHNT